MIYTATCRSPCWLASPVFRVAVRVSDSWNPEIWLAFAAGLELTVRLSHLGAAGLLCRPAVILRLSRSLPTCRYSTY